ncbi:hypothetical protein Gotur_002895 [Gossypium turneri]
MKSYESSFGSVSGARVRYEACRFDCGADTSRKGCKGPFKVHKQGGQWIVGNTKLRCENQDDSKGNKSKVEAS